MLIQGGKNYYNVLLSTIRAKTIACLFHNYLSHIPPSSAQAPIWPSRMLTQEKPKAYSSVSYASYFLWRGAAIILSKEVMQCLLFDFMEDDLRKSFNDAAHFSGLHSPEEESLSSLLHASEYILDEADAMKASMPTYNKLFDMCSFALPEGRSIPLDYDTLENTRNAMEAGAPEGESEAEAAGVVRTCVLGC